MYFPTPYDIAENWHEQFGTDNKEKSLTQQSDASETNINVIVERFTKTGMIPQVQMEASYGDHTHVTDYRTALHMVQSINEEFKALPAAIRKQFDHDPQQFINYALDPANKDELKKMGITPPDKPKAATLDDAVSAIRELKPKETENGQSKTG